MTDFIMYAIKTVILVWSKDWHLLNLRSHFLILYNWFKSASDRHFIILYNWFKSASDVNECKTIIARCDSHSVCINTPGSFRCICLPNFQMNDKNVCVGKQSNPVHIATFFTIILYKMIALSILNETLRTSWDKPITVTIMKYEKQE